MLAGGGSCSVAKGMFCRQMFPSTDSVEYASRPCFETAGVDALLPSASRCRPGLPESRSIQERANPGIKLGFRVVKINCRPVGNHAGLLAGPAPEIGRAAPA